MPPVLAFLKMGIHEDMTINDRILMDVWGRGGGDVLCFQTNPNVDAYKLIPD